MDRASTIDEEDAVPIQVDELQIMIVIDKEEVPVPRRLELRRIHLGQGHPGIHAACVAVAVDAWACVHNAVETDPYRYCLRILRASDSLWTSSAPS